MNYKLGKYCILLAVHHPPNRLKTPISYVVTGFDVNVLVGSCLIGMLSSVYGLRNTQQMNASLNKVEIYSFIPLFSLHVYFSTSLSAIPFSHSVCCCFCYLDRFFVRRKISNYNHLQADQKLMGLCANISVHTNGARRLLTTFVSITLAYIGMMLGKRFFIFPKVAHTSVPLCHSNDNARYSEAQSDGKTLLKPIHQ